MANSLYVPENTTLGVSAETTPIDLPDFGGTARARALMLIAAGISPLPLPWGSKRPEGRDAVGWPEIRVTEGNLEKYFPGDEMNIGMFLGSTSGGLVDIDLDCPEAVTLAPYFLPPTAAMFGRVSTRASHWLFKTCVSLTNTQGVVNFEDPECVGPGRKVILEFRCGDGLGDPSVKPKGIQTMSPGSLHRESGEIVEWERMSIEGKVPEIGVVDGNDLLRRVGLLAAAVLCVRSWSEGSRQDAALTLGGFLARAGMPESEIKVFVEAVARGAGDLQVKERIRACADAAAAHARGEQARGLPSLTTWVGGKRANAIAKWLGYSGGRTAQPDAAKSDVDIAQSVAGKGDIKKKEADLGEKTPEKRSLNAALSALSEQYSVVKTGGKTLVWSLEKDHVSGLKNLEHINFQNFRDYYSTEKFTAENPRDPSKKILRSLGEIWLEHENRPTYRGFTFDPRGGRIVDGLVNLWTGFNVNPVPGSWDRLKSHICDNLAGGNPVYAAYILNWCAWAVQNPEKPAEVALVFRGIQGSGKGTLCNTMVKIFGNHGKFIANSIHAIGKFNGHLQNTSLLFIDEANFTNQNYSGLLKSLITEPMILLERKNIDAINTASRLHLMLASNSESIVPAERGERRYAVFDVSAARARDENYFGALNRELDSGGREAFLAALLAMDITGFHPRALPATAALRDQQAANLAGLEAAFVELLESGMLPGQALGGPANEAVSGDSDVSQPGLLAWLRRSSPDLRFVSDHKIGAFLKKVGATNVKKIHRRAGWTFPPLMQLRREWEEKFPGWTWRCPDILQWQSY